MSEDRTLRFLRRLHGETGPNARTPEEADALFRVLCTAEVLSAALSHVKARLQSRGFLTSCRNEESDSGILCAPETCDECDIERALQARQRPVETYRALKMACLDVYYREQAKLSEEPGDVRAQENVQLLARGLFGQSE